MGLTSLLGGSVCARLGSQARSERDLSVALVNGGMVDEFAAHEHAWEELTRGTRLAEYVSHTCDWITFRCLYKMSRRQHELFPAFRRRLMAWMDRRGVPFKAPILPVEAARQFIREKADG